MTAEHEINHEIRLITTTWHGSAHEEDFYDNFVNYNKNILSQCRGGQYNEILDISDASIINFSADGIKKLLQTINQYDAFCETSKRAVIFGKKIPPELGNLYLSYRSLLYKGKKQARIFHNREDALEWLSSNG